MQIPRPERYAVHKLILAARRHPSSALKAKKDLAQAEVLFEVLSEDRPEELSAALSLAMEKGPAWREAIKKSINQATKIAKIISI